MTLAEFCQKPFQHNHPQYDNSCLSIGVQPEYATGDVLLGSCYRALGLIDIQESEVNLENIDSLPQQLETVSSEVEMWRLLFEQALRSPERPRESRALPQLTPLVPSLGAYSGVLGRPRSRWNPGKLAIYALACGIGPVGTPELLYALAAKLDVFEREDDQFAIFLDNSVSSLLGDLRNPIGDDWQPPNIEWIQVPYRQEIGPPLSPSEVFAQDLAHLLQLKDSLTRRQWCALIESLLRLGLSTHVLWICRLNYYVWQEMQKILGGGIPPTQESIEETWWQRHLGYGAFLEGGQGSDSYFSRHVESYATARLGINLVLHGLHDANYGWTLDEVNDYGLPTSYQISNMLSHVSAARESLSTDPRDWAMSELGRILDQESSKISGNSGAPKNLKEFLVHTLRRRPSKEPSLSEHDQGYLLTKLPGPLNAPWVVRPGPVLLLALSYSTWKSQEGAPVTLRDLARRFSYYGVRLSTGDLQSGTIAEDLGSLGVLVDSPDAGGGRLVLNPFEAAL